MKWLDRELIRNPFYMCLCKDEKSFHRAMRHLKIAKPWAQWVTDGKDARVHWVESNQGKQCVIICVKGWRKRTRIEIDGLLIHESVHIWQWIKSELNESEPSKEFEAYSVQHLAQTLIEAFHAG